MQKVVCVFAGGQNGDVLTASSVLKYRDKLWGNDHKIIWYINPENRDLLAYQDIELRDFPRGFGFPEMTIEKNEQLINSGKEPIWADFEPLVSLDNKMDLLLKSNYPELHEITEGYFPLPHQLSVEQRHGIPYTNCSKKVFGIPDDWEWHPYLRFSEDEILDAHDFCQNLPYEKTVMIETFAGSGQSILSHEMIMNAMQVCREWWGDCNFIFCSHKYLNSQEDFPEGLFEKGVVSAAHFTVRQCALLANYSDLLISVSSGVTVAVSCWGNQPLQILQYCGSFICSTVNIANGPIELVTADENPNSEQEFYLKLIEILNKL